jgi:hypothetical protein
VKTRHNPRADEARAAIQAYTAEMFADERMVADEAQVRIALLRGITRLPLRIERGGLVFDEQRGVSVWRENVLTAVLWERGARI